MKLLFKLSFYSAHDLIQFIQVLLKQQVWSIVNNTKIA